MTKCGIDDKLDSLEIVSVGADKELQLQKSLASMINEWDNIDIPIGKYKETDIAILGNCDDIQVRWKNYYFLSQEINYLFCLNRQF